MNRHALLLITTGKQELGEAAAIAGSLPQGLADALFIREKHRGAREVAEWYDTLRRSAPDLPVFINDRLDAAAAVGAPGVQLGYSSLPPQAARRILAPGTRIGVSVHSPEEAAAVSLEGAADYVLFGHIYATASKAGLAPRGPEALRKVVAASAIPVIAIGGIGPEHVHEVLATGCAGIAVLSGVLLYTTPAERLRQYREAMASSPFCPKVSWQG
jgi:thiazole tautomerase (transcriptional regulator TenI)